MNEKVATEISWRYANDLTHENSKDNFSRETRTCTILKMLRVVHLNFKILGIPIYIWTFKMRITLTQC